MQVRFMANCDLAQAANRLQLTFGAGLCLHSNTGATRLRADRRLIQTSQLHAGEVLVLWNVLNVLPDNMHTSICSSTLLN